MEEKDHLITLTDEDGNEFECEILDMIEYQGKQYAVLGTEDTDKTGEVMIVEYIFGGEDEDADTLDSVEEEDILNAVFDLFLAHADEADEDEDGDAPEDQA